MYTHVTSFFLCVLVYIVGYVIVKYPKRLSSLIGYKKKTMRLIFRMLGHAIVDGITRTRTGALYVIEFLKTIETPLVMYNSTYTQTVNGVNGISVIAE